MVPPRAGVPFIPVDTCPLLLPQQQQVPWSDQVISIPSRVRGDAEVHVAQLGGDQLFRLLSSVLSPWSWQAKGRAFFPCWIWSLSH